MIRAAMAVAAVATGSHERAVWARAARWHRVRAIAIDTIVFGVISLIVNSVYGVAHIETFPQVTIGGGTFTTAISVPLQMVLGLLYFAVPEAMFGATPGKWWARLKVVRLDGRPLRIQDVVVRNVLRLVDYLPALYLLGGASVGATRGSQRLGDVAAGTTVVAEDHATEPGATRTSGPRARRILAWSLVGALVFTLAFDYFGRPPLVLQGDFNQHLFVMHDVDWYELGQPTWGLGTVSYPIRARSGASTCVGTVELDWSFLAWNDGSGNLECRSS